MSDPLDTLRTVLKIADFGRAVSRKLTSIRFVHESDEQTLNRVIAQARKTICTWCGGDGHSAIGSECRECHGSGERAYDPNEKPVRDVMDS